MSRFARRIDDNHREIVSEIRARGFYWLDTARLGSGAPDGFAFKDGRVIPIEIKDGRKVPSAQKLTEDEAKVAAACQAHGVPVVILRRVEDVAGL